MTRDYHIANLPHVRVYVMYSNLVIFLIFPSRPIDGRLLLSIGACRVMMLMLCMFHWRMGVAVQKRRGVVVEDDLYFDDVSSLLDEKIIDVDVIYIFLCRSIVVLFCASQYTQKEMARSYDGIYNNTCTGVSTKTTNHRNDMASLFSVGC